MFPRRAIIAGPVTLTGDVSIGGTLSVTGTSTLAAVNASGTVAAAGAVTVGTTLGVTGASTLTGDIAAGNINMASGKIVTLDAGSLAAPSLRFSNSASNTGISSTAADVIQVGRSGAAQFRLAHSSGPQADTTFVAAGTMTASSTFNAQAKLGVVAESIKTADYTAANNDAIVIMNGSNVTLTLNSTPGGSQMLWVKNIHSTALTIARNGNTIDGTTNNITLNQYEFALLHFEASGWFRIGG